MTPRGPYQGGGPEEPEETGGESREDGNPHDGDDPTLKGWVPPEERTWRHPSELAGSPGAGAPQSGPGGGQSRPGKRRPPRDASDRAPGAQSGLSRGRPVATGVVTGVAAAAVTVGILLLVHTGTPNTAPQGHASPAPVVGQGPQETRTLSAMASHMQRSMVGLQVSADGHTTQSCAVAVGADGLVVTTAGALRDATSVRGVTAGGRQLAAQIVATDPGSGLAILRVSTSLPVAHFVDDGTLTAGHQLMVLIPSVTGDRQRLRVRWVLSTVQSVGTPLSGGEATGMADIGARVPAGGDVAGALLVGQGGGVMGILDSKSAGPTGPEQNPPPSAVSARRQKSARRENKTQEDVFLPTQLVVGVSDQLAAGGSVQHGWLDIEGRNLTRAVSTTSTLGTAAPPAGGAVVVKVDATGASAHVLRAGDVITGVDGAPVRSLAELRSRLYVVSAGKPVELSIWRAGAHLSARVDLSGSP